jgi:hypothetical protein
MKIETVHRAATSTDFAATVLDRIPLVLPTDSSPAALRALVKALRAIPGTARTNVRPAPAEVLAMAGRPRPV